MEIITYKPSPKGAKVAHFSIKIPKWGNFIINDMTLFSKDGKRWCSFPSRSYEKDGATKYFPYVTFEDKSTLSTFQAKLLEAVDAWLIAHPELAEPSLPPSSDGDLPF